MKRFLAFVVLVAALGCGDTTLGPVQTVDGQWNGANNGLEMGINMSQADTLVNANVLIASAGGTLQGFGNGTFHYPNLQIVIGVQGIAEPIIYTGTMSTTEAKIFGHLDGSGFNNFSIDVKKQ